MTEKTKFSTLSVELSLGEGAALPKEVRLFRAGVNETTKGDFIFSALSAKKVMADRRAKKTDVSWDYHHASHKAHLSADPARAAAAAGWSKLELRKDENGADELWAVDCTWTPKAAQALADREYRYASPAFNRNEKNEIIDIVNIALTATPATFDAHTIVASQTTDTPEEKPKMKTLFSLLSLSAEATEVEATIALQGIQGDRAALLSATEASSVAEATGKIAAWKATAKQHAELSAKVAEIEAAAKKNEVKSMLDAAQKEGKVAPVEVAFLTAMGERNVEELKGFLAIKPKVVGVPAVPPAGSAQGSNSIGMLSAEQLHVAKLTGQDPKALAEFIQAKGQIEVGVAK